MRKHIGFVHFCGSRNINETLNGRFLSFLSSPIITFLPPILAKFASNCYYQGADINIIIGICKYTYSMPKPKPPQMATVKTIAIIKFWFFIGLFPIWKLIPQYNNRVFDIFPNKIKIVTNVSINNATQQQLNKREYHHSACNIYKLNNLYKYIMII